jgi:hypothetical protein
MRRATALALLLLPTGCGPGPLQLEVRESGGRLHVEVYRQGWFGTRSDAVPCVHTIELRRGPGPGGGALLWRAEVPPARQCGDLKAFVVGRAPPGFAERVRMAPGRLAGHYLLAVSGIGEGEQAIALPE